MSDICNSCGADDVHVEYRKFPKWDDEGGDCYDMRQGFGIYYCSECLREAKDQYFEEFKEGCWCSYGECPKCGEKCWQDVKEEPNLLRREKHLPNEDGGEDWTEWWKCPKCGSEFKEGNGYP